jgi:3-oxoadipate enol-lactonase
VLRINRPARVFTVVSLGLLAVLAAPLAGAQMEGPTPEPGSFVQVENGKIHYQECGSGTATVLLIHDGIADSSVWDGVWPSFCQNFHTIRYDRRGFGESSAPTTWYYETDDIAALLHYLKVPRVVLVGSSHGGEVSIDFTLNHADMVQQLVLVGAVVSGMPYTDHFLDRGIQNSKPFEQHDVKTGLENWANDKYLLAPGHEAAKKKLLEILQRSPQDMTHEDYARPTQAALPRLREIRVPTLILTGDADIPDVHAHAGAIEAGIPGSRRVVLKETGHLMYLEKPEEFSSVVLAFIRANLN